MNAEGWTEESSAPQEAERHLVLEWISKESLWLGTSVFDLKGILSEYDSDWKVVSHTFNIQEDGSGLLTCILERVRG
jgi:hypothetical protein